VSSLADIWSRLVLEGETTVGYVRLRVPLVGACAVYAARSIGSSLEALVVEVATASLPGDVELPRSAGFEVIPTVIDPGRGGRIRIVLALRDARYVDVFRALCEDLVHRMASVTQEADAVRVLTLQLARWQAFLRAAGMEGLSLERRRGLAGELTFLRDELLPRMGDLAVKGWMGWAAANHDFQLPGGSVEVKTTAANTPHAFRVSNVGQLDDRTTTALYVCLTRVDESQNSGESLREVVESLRDRLHPSVAVALEDRLAQVGFVMAAGSMYAFPRYNVRGRQMFHVLPGFPRITADDLPLGVETVEYSVAIAACKPFLSDLDAILTSLVRQESTPLEH
jgi:hypothetical protein